MPNTRKMKWGGLLIAGLALAASLIVAPLDAYAADVPTPELKDSFVVSGELFDRSLSGKYLILKQGYSGDGTQLLVVNADDGSQIQASTFIDDYDCRGGDYRGAYCFSNKEDFFYSYDPEQSEIIGYPLGDKGELESTPVDPSAVERNLWQLGLSDDGNTFFLTSSDTLSVRFSKIDRKTGKVLSVYSAPFFEDNSCAGSSAWTSLDGKYGYVNYPAGDKLTTINLDSETIDNEINTRVLKLSSFGSPVRVMADGTLFSSGVFVSNKGEVAATNERKEISEHSYNADGSLTGMLSSQLDGGGSSSSERVSECSLSVVDSVTGKTKWKSSFSTKNYSDQTRISSLSSDGALALTYAVDDDGSGSLYLVDTKTGSSSQISVKSGFDYDVFGFGDSWSAYLGPAYFSQDNSKVYVVRDLDDDSASIDVYEIGASGGLLSPAAQHDGDSSSFNPIIIVVVVAILLAAGVGGFVVIRMRKHSKGCAATANGTIPAAPQQTMPQNFVGQQAQAQPQQTPASSDAPRFCSSCGSPLTLDSQFCPHCGAPVKH